MVTALQEQPDIEIKWSAKKHYSRRDAAIIGTRLMQLTQERGERLVPDDVVDEASKPNSPLHGFFEWNDRIAASAYRIVQARYMLRTIEVEIIGKDGAQLFNGPIRAFHTVVIERQAKPESALPVAIDDEVEDGETAAKDRVFITIQRLASEPDLITQKLEDAEREIKAWSSRYRQYRSMEQWQARFGVIDRAIEEALSANV